MKKLIIPLFMFLCVTTMKAQSYLGYLTDNYSGVNSVIANPANITDSRFKADINLVGISAFGNNDYYGVNVFDAIKDDYDFDLDAKKSPSDNNNANINIDVLGPAFMFNLTKNSSLAVFTRGRSMVNINKINGNTIDGLDNDETDDFNVDEGDFKAFGQAWGELGVTYAQILLNKGQHFLKGGLTVKYLQGGGSAYAYGKNVTIDYDADGTDLGGGDLVGRLATTGELTYGRFTEFDGDDYDYDLPDAMGIGADLGFVYEWRPDHDQYSSANASGQTVSQKNKNKYKLKLGVSLTDFGSIKYKEGIEETFDVNNNNVSEEDINNADNIAEILHDNYTLTNTNNGYTTKLPTALHLNADWSFTNKLFLNLNTDLSLVAKDKENASRISNMVSLTPRFESKWFSFYIPLSYIETSGFAAGAGLRAGPLYLGSGSLLSALVGDENKDADVYAGIKIPIYQGRTKDKDNDGVADSIDGCPKLAGPAENNGCPWGDSDNDGILDNEDNCPEAYGVAENNGCPWGDKDNDGVLDNEDKCPDQAGTTENNGCPLIDTDGDGIVDNEDACPEVPGIAENKGCPKDTDGDGVADINDNCPETKGTLANQGCPEITKEVQQALNSYAKTILFDTGKSTISAKSNVVLSDIVGVLKEYPNARFAIEGHTDSVGSDALNLRLSEQRANAVKDYLVGNGIDAGRLTAQGFGETRPLADNTTREGRERNRRVEINLIK
ncbi:MAG: DUF5723 family protein [Flavobacteriaceae bacterium]